MLEGGKGTSGVPVNVQIKPSREEATILAALDRRFINFPYATEGMDVEIPQGTTMRQPSRPPRPIPTSAQPTREKKRLRDNNADDDIDDEPPEREPKRYKGDYDELYDQYSRVVIQRDALITEVKELKRVIAQLSGTSGPHH